MNYEEDKYYFNDHEIKLSDIELLSLQIHSQLEIHSVEIDFLNNKLTEILFFYQLFHVK
jgi:hypothetical protein